ncbi:CfaE/CblD family pilus tip adhesin, partial [Escherichia sp. R-CC3]
HTHHGIANTGQYHRTHTFQVNAVMCVPTPLTLAVDKFSVMDKQAGYYMGKLSVIFTPSLPTIN